VQKDYQAGLFALLSEITEAVLGEREVADPQFACSCWRKSDPDERPSPAILAYFSLWTVRLGGWLGSLDECASAARHSEGRCVRFAGSSGLSCGDCREGWRNQYLK